MIGNKVCFFQSIESTNVFLKDNITDFKHGDMVCARIQTAGIGRRRRNWVSKDGNLHTSFVIDQDITPYEIFEVVMHTSVAIVVLLKEYGISATIKYPNDILVNGKKIAGILIEKVEDKYIIGVGINVAFSNHEAYDFSPSSILLETGKLVDYRDVLSAFIHAFNSVRDITLEEIYNIYKGYSIVLDKEIHINTDIVKIIDITPLGELVYEQNGKQVKAVFNEISLKELYND